MMENKCFMMKILGILLISSFIGCTDLEPDVVDGIIDTDASGASTGNASTDNLLLTAYESLRQYQNQTRSHIVSEHTSDAMVGPTRGGDWDDNGIWRQLHVHSWNPLHQYLNETWIEMSSGVFNCNQVLNNNPTLIQAAEAKVIRAYHYFFLIDMFGTVPFKEVGAPLNAQSIPLPRMEATQMMIDDLEDVVSDLSELSNATVASKDAARFLLAKFYLNKAVFTSDNPAGPYSFDINDLNKVIENVDAMTASLATDYWDNFKPDNSESSPEIIFASRNIKGGSGGNVAARWRMGNHYNQSPDGWNGFTTLAEYYDRFDPDDIRINNPDQDAFDNSGYNLGYQLGQQYSEPYDVPFDQLPDKTQEDLGGRIWFADPTNQTGWVQLPDGRFELKDRANRKMVFTKEVELLNGGATIETAGIRGVKYKPDYDNINNPDNDYILARYSDALLMKAEAIARGGSAAETAAMIVNRIRDRVDQPALPSVTLDEIYAERGRELWWEGWRRNDMIRFETFLGSKELKPTTSGEERVLFTIPAGALASFPQNPGY